MDKIKNTISKIELIHIAVILVFIIFILFLIYQNKSITPYKTSINEDMEIEELAANEKVVSDINEKKKKITCTLETSKLPEKEYYNYVTGKGKSKDVDCEILVKQDGQYYKIKTIQEGDTKASKINLVGCIKNKKLKEEYEIFLYDKQKQKLYKYTGGVSEENS